jgi:hypothetical protein
MERDFSSYNDDQLHQMITDIRAELSERDKQRKKKAAARIKALANAAGLSVSVADKPRKRRGRPPKAGDQ